MKIVLALNYIYEIPSEFSAMNCQNLYMYIVCESNKKTLYSSDQKVYYSYFYYKLQFVIYTIHSGWPTSRQKSNVIVQFAIEPSPLAAVPWI